MRICLDKVDNLIFIDKPLDHECLNPSLIVSVNVLAAANLPFASEPAFVSVPAVAGVIAVAFCLITGATTVFSDAGISADDWVPYDSRFPANVGVLSSNRVGRVGGGVG